MPSLPLLRAIGLNFSPNQLETSPGSLVEASNVIIRRDNVIESRRGYALYGTAMGTTTDRCKQLISYKNKLIRHFSNRLQYEDGINNAGDAAFFDFDEIVNGVTQQAQITEAQTGLRIKSIEANSNLYLTTSEGIKKISAKSANAFAASPVTKAGGVKALDVEAQLTTSIGNQAGFLSADSGVSYKVVWGTKDANGNLILGAPSSSATVLNSLFELTLRDFSNFLLQLDNTANSNPGNSLISDTNYYSSLALPITADSSQLRSNLIACAKKLDEDLQYASDTGTGLPYAQLKIAPTVSTTAAITTGLSTITVTSASGILEGMTISGNGVSGTVLSISGTTVTLSGASTLTISSTPVTFYGIGASSGTITSVFSNTLAITGSNSGGDLLFTAGSPHGFKVGMPVQFYATTYPGNISTNSTTYYVVASGLTPTAFKVSTSSGGTPVLFSSSGSGVVVSLAAGAYFSSADSINLGGFKSNAVDIGALNSANTVSSVNANRITFVAKNYSATNPVGISGTITDIPTTSTSDTGTLILTCPGHALKTNQKINISGSDSVPSINGSGYTITSLSDDTFSIDLKKSFSNPNFTSTNAVTFQDTGDTVTLNGHNLLTNDSVVFTVITTTTGISINTRYYVVNPTTNTFQVASSPGGAALPLTNNGTGTVARAPSQYLTSTDHGYAVGDTVVFNQTSPLSEAVTFTDATDAVTMSAATNLPHGFNNGDTLQFTSIVSTTGISINTKYYVVNATATSFQLSATQNGSALPLTTNGTGVMQRLNSSLTYYVISDGLGPSVFKVSSSLNGSPSVVTGSGNVTKQIVTAGNSATWNIMVDGISSSKIESNAFRSISEPAETSSPPTNNDSVALKNYYSNILTELQDIITIHNDTIVDNVIYTTYLSNLDVTETASVILKFSIPSTILNYTEANNPYFFQIYRTDIATVSGVSSISDIAIIEEYKQIEEKFPTQAQLTAGIVEFLDETPESIAGTGANLYTNERTGEGGLQANDTPPFAKDINSFKGYTFFSNTKTKQRKTLTMIGVANMVSNFNPADPYKLTISNGVTTNTYQFVTGLKETTDLTCNSAAGLSVGVSSYFLINSANNETEYYVWYKVGTSTDPAIAGKTGIEVVVNSTDTNTVVAQKTSDTINNNMVDFTASVSTNVVTIVNTEEGPTTDATVGTLPAGFSILVTQQGRGEDVSTNQILISSSPSAGIAIEDTAKSLIRVINRNSNETINAFYISSTTTAPGTIFLESRDLSDDEFYLLGGDSIIGGSFNPDISPSSIVINNISIANPTVITTASPHGLLNGDKIIISNSNSTPSINGVYQITYQNATTFSIPVNVTVAGTSAVFKSLNSAEGSSNEEQPHRVYYSKYQQPESVPLLNYLDVGATDKQILRIFPLRDSLFIFKQDGLYRISGEVAPFTVALFDSSCILISPDSVSVANNQIYGWTTQGISIITEAGVNVISRPIDTEILKKGSSSYTNFKSATWGIGYESDNSYTVYTTDNPEDDKGTIGFRYSNLTNSWTTVDKTVTCGIINPADDKLYMGAGDTNYLEKERKDFNRYDYADRELDYSILDNAISGKDLNLSSGITELSIGDVVVQNQTLTVYEFNMLLKKLDIDVGVPSSDYYSTLASQAGNNMRTKLVALANKLDSELTPGYLALINTQSGSVSTASIANPTVIATTAPHGLQTGRIVTISGNTESDVNGTFEVTVTSPTTFTIPVDLLIAGTGGNFSTNDSNFLDLKDCYNAIIAKLNADPIPAFSNYAPIDTDTVQESIITAIHVPTSKVTLNLALDYIVGDIVIYKAIPCSLIYSPLTMGDPLGIKHVREATMMFANKAFTKAQMNFSTDLLPETIPVDFPGDGNGIFGFSNFGSGFFGGTSNSAPFRTFVPRQCQRCRFINVGFLHNTAREQFAIYGVTLTGEVSISTRAYR